MTKKDFFRIFIKLFALFAFIETVFSLVKTIANSFTSEIQFYLIIFNLVVILGVLMLLKFVIAKPDFVINFFKLDKNFDDDNIVLGNLNSEKLLNLGLFTVGIYFVITSISSLVSSMYLLLGTTSMMQNPYFKDIWSKQGLIISLVNLLVGLLLIVYRKNITTYVEK